MADLKRTRMVIALASDPDTPVEVEAINPDFLRIEAAAPQFGLAPDPKGQPMTYMTCLAWAAMRRLNLYSGELPTFKSTDCVYLQVVKDADEDDDAVPPTPPVPATGSPSSSQATTGDSTSG